MPTGLPGADSDVVVTHEIGGDTLLKLSNQLFGKNPAFWGRYFKQRGGTSSQLYHAAIESPVLSAAKIKLAPLSQHTPDVGGSASTGQIEAHSDVDAILDAFAVAHLAAQGTEFLVFLDIEPGRNLSMDYYTGWSQALKSYSAQKSGGAFTFLPAVYSNRLNTAWQIVSAAIGKGGGAVTCSGWWVAGWYSHGGCIVPGKWDNGMAIPQGIAHPSPVLIWQYSNDCHGQHGIDCNQSNPNIDVNGLLMNRLIQP